MFYISENTFDAVSISLAADSKLEAKSTECSFEVGCIVDEERDFVEVVFFAELSKERNSELRRSCLKQLYVKKSIRIRVDGGVQPVTLSIHSDHGFVNRDPIRIAIAIGL